MCTKFEALLMILKMFLMNFCSTHHRTHSTITESAARFTTWPTSSIMDSHQFHHGFPLNAISEKIERIRRSINDLKSQNRVSACGNENSSTRPSSNSTDRVPHPAVPVSPLLSDEEMVGYENEKKIFTRQLVDGEKRVVTLAVVGPGGSGKTTFVENIFRKRRIRGRFDCHAWVHVSQHFKEEGCKPFDIMLKQFCDSMKEPYPIDDGLTAPEKLQKYLTGKRFILVLDDIWRQKDWDFIKGGLPKTSNGSRIIVTTRSDDVASICVSSNPSFAERHQYRHELTRLETHKASTLFYKKAFPDSEGQCPPELKDWSERIIARFEGLPLAIVAAGGALSLKPRLPDVWERFHNSLGRDVMRDSNLAFISNSLLPSYLDLSSNLKSCFLYFSIFPKDYSVERGRLIRLWVAEQFAVETDDLTAEQVAVDYLDQLIQMNLVDVSNWDFDGRRPRNCRVVNLVHTFITNKCKYENFASIFARESKSRNQKIRRLSVHDNITHLPRESAFIGVHSMFLLRLLEISMPDFEKIVEGLKFVRVLDFQGAPITEFPKDITRLTLLKYLNFRGTKISMIPSSIEKLSYLETLDLKQTNVTELPKEISHLRNLCHLSAYKNIVESNVVFESVQGVKIYEGIENLTNLQALSLVKVGKRVRILEELKKLKKLRKLGLMGLETKHGKELFASLEQMPQLTTLNLCSNTKEEFLGLEEMRNPPLKLQRLYFKGRLNQLPTWISSLNSLLKIGLKWSKMSISPLQALQLLPNLMELQLVDCYTGNELEFEASSFRKLKILLIEEFSQLQRIVIQNGAMPDVKQISLRRCPQVMNFSLGIDNHLAKVKELTLHDMAPEFIAGFRKNGKNRDMVKHIHLIHSYTHGLQSSSCENLSESFLH